MTPAARVPDSGQWFMSILLFKAGLHFSLESGSLHASSTTSTGSQSLLLCLDGLGVSLSYGDEPHFSLVHPYAGLRITQLSNRYCSSHMFSPQPSKSVLLYISMFKKRIFCSISHHVQ